LSPMKSHHTEYLRHNELFTNDATLHVYEKAMLAFTFQRSALTYDAINGSVANC